MEKRTGSIQQDVDSNLLGRSKVLTLLKHPLPAMHSRTSCSVQGAGDPNRKETVPALWVLTVRAGNTCRLSLSRPPYLLNSEQV